MTARLTAGLGKPYRVTPDEATCICWFVAVDLIAQNMNEGFTSGLGLMIPKLKPR